VVEGVTTLVASFDELLCSNNANWFSAQPSPHVLFTSLQPRDSLGHSGFAAVELHIPESNPPVSITWPWSTYVVGAYPVAVKVIRGSEAVSFVGVHPVRKFKSLVSKS
jgi:hypothetical protein